MRSSVSLKEKEAVQESQEKPAVVALVGSPNSGKTTLFNWLTGARFKTVNYPGSTVDYSVGRSHDRYGEAISLMDTPGAYSLDPKSPDEEVTLKAIFEHKDHGISRLVISVVDATLLSRQLYVTKQLLGAGFPVVLAVTMNDLLNEANERINKEALSRALGVPVVLIDGRLGGGVDELLKVVRAELEKPAAEKVRRPLRWDENAIEAELRSIEALARQVTETLATNLSRPVSNARERTRKIDRVLLHPVGGLLIFVALMTLLFSAIFWAAAPLMDLVDQGFSRLAGIIVGMVPEGLLAQFISDGVIASITAVMVFVPQIFVLFLGIILLEDSGYLARSATLIDRPLSWIGLGGRSFVPLLSGYACAIPAMLSARTINSRRERWLTLFIIPLMSCSARLPVYALLLTFIFHDGSAFAAGLTLTAIYLGSLLAGAIGAWLASLFLKFDDRSFFMLELPVYRRPRFELVLKQAISRTKNYVVRAGPAIFTFALLVWVGTTFPRYDLEGSERLNASYAAQLGQVIEPVFKPMGGDWRTGVSLISAFAAREVFVSSLAVLMQVTDENEETLQAGLIEKMQQAKAPDGMPLFTLASVIGLIIFFMIALQCLTTFVVAAKESGGWRFAVVQLVVFNLVAYALAVGVVQGLRAFGIN